MIRFLKNNQIQTLLAVLVLLSIYYWVLSALQATPSSANAYPIPVVIVKSIQSTGISWINSSLNFILILIPAILFGGFIQRYQVLHKSTWLPGLFFGLFCLIFPYQLGLNATVIANLFLILSFTFLFQAQGKEFALPQLINTGMSLGVASFFGPEVVLFLPVIVFGMYAFKPGRVLDILQLLLGYCLPWYFLAALSYSLNWGIDFSPYWETSLLEWGLPNFSDDLSRLIFFTLLGVLFIYIFIQVQRNFFRNTIRVRKYQQFMLLYFLSSLLVSFLSAKPLEETFVYLAAPLSVYLSYFFLSDKRKFLYESIFYLFILGLLMVQFSWL